MHDSLLKSFASKVLSPWTFYQNWVQKFDNNPVSCPHVFIFTTNVCLSKKYNTLSLYARWCSRLYYSLRTFKSATYWQFGRSTGCVHICRRLHGTANHGTDTPDSCPSPDLLLPSWRRYDSSRRLVHELARPRHETPPGFYLKTISCMRAHLMFSVHIS